MTLLSVAEMRTFLETDVVDASLQFILDAAEQTINDVAGDLGNQVQLFSDAPHGLAHGRQLFLNKKASAIVSIVEQDSPDDEEPTTISADDYSLIGGRKLIRLGTGTNARLTWARHTTVTYTPVSDAALRKSVQQELVKIAVTMTGNQSVTFGDFTASHGDAFDRRVQSALSPLVNGRNRLLVV
jgi:hypothetical protein